MVAWSALFWPYPGGLSDLSDKDFLNFLYQFVKCCEKWRESVKEFVEILKIFVEKFGCLIRILIRNYVFPIPIQKMLWENEGKCKGISDYFWCKSFVDLCNSYGICWMFVDKLGCLIRLSDKDFINFVWIV